MWPLQAVLALIGWFSFKFQYGKNKENTPDGEGKGALQVKTRAEVHSEQGPPVLVDPPVPEVKTPPTQSELERRVEEAEKVGEVRRSPESSLT